MTKKFIVTVSIAIVLLIALNVIFSAVGVMPFDWFTVGIEFLVLIPVFIIAYGFIRLGGDEQ